MTDTIPSADKMLAFLADASPDHIRKVTAVAWEVDEGQFDGPIWADRREHAARFLRAAWDRKVEWWKVRFSDDEVLEWLNSLESVRRAWARTQGRRKRHLPPLEHDPLDYWREFVERHFRRWAARVIEKGRHTHTDWPLGRYWLERRADALFIGWEWMHGVGSAVYNYLYTDSAGDLIRERQAIRKMHADAINGLRALEAFMETKFSRHIEHPHFGALTPDGRIASEGRHLKPWVMSTSRRSTLQRGTTPLLRNAFLSHRSLICTARYSEPRSQRLLRKSWRPRSSGTR